MNESKQPPTAAHHRTDHSTIDRWLVAFARAGAVWHPFLAAALWRARTQGGRR